MVPPPRLRPVSYTHLDVYKRQEHVSSGQEPLNLKKFIYDLDVPVIVGGASNYTAALHLMRTGAAGVLVGFGGGAVSATRQTIGVQAPMATAIADVAEARRDRCV